MDKCYLRNKKAEKTKCVLESELYRMKHTEFMKQLNINSIDHLKQKKNIEMSKSYHIKRNEKR